MNPIVEHNLALMLANDRGGMKYLLYNESIGGNAGAYGSLPCVGLNFRYNTMNGELVTFGNFQDIQPAILHTTAGGTFRAVVDIRAGTIGIISINLEKPVPAATAIADAARRFNQLNKFSQGPFAA